MGVTVSKHGRRPITEHYGNMWNMMSKTVASLYIVVRASSADALLGQLEGVAGPGSQSQVGF